MSFKTDYQKKIVKNLQKKTKITNLHAVPRITKITVNVGIGTYMRGEKKPESVVDGISLVTGQKPVVRNSRMSISNFKLREGMPVGVFVTLRGQRMYDFFERLVKIVLPRIRDFRGFPKKSFDGRGNYSFGIRDHLIFPEIPSDKVIKPFGLQITLSTNTDSDENALMLMEEFGFPFHKTNG